MSAFGGDSWGREAHHRKRRLDSFLLSSQSDSSYKKLTNGKLACLICPNAPILDSPLMLSVHRKGSRHVAAEKRIRERDLEIRAEKNKRIALSNNKSVTVAAVAYEQSEKGDSCGSRVDEGLGEEWRKRREKELQFTSAGWKRDGHGRWYRDENVEFDSDEEDPNVYFS